jgi:23S rRNA (cytosine1962-C5)-methyltransferase
VNHQNHAEQLTNRLRKQRRKLDTWAKRQSISCLRLYDCDIPEIPLQIDWYEGAVCVAWLPTQTIHVDADHPHPWLDAMRDAIAAALEIEPALIFPRLRLRRRGGWQYARLSRERVTRTVHEGGLKFEVNLTDYLDTGLFLDHRRTRALLRAESSGKRVLNLFSYTGSFTVYAAAGGASQTLSIDLSGNYSDWAERNLALNGLSGPQHRVLAADVLGWLDQCAQNPKSSAKNNGGPFDIIICDPPTHSTSERAARDWDVQTDHPHMLMQLHALLSDQGVIYFSNNLRSFVLNADALTPAFILANITQRTASADFERSHPHQCWRLVKK